MLAVGRHVSWSNHLVVCRFIGFNRKGSYGGSHDCFAYHGVASDPPLQNSSSEKAESIMGQNCLDKQHSRELI